MSKKVHQKGSDIPRDLYRLSEVCRLLSLSPGIVRKLLIERKLMMFDVRRLSSTATAWRIPRGTYLKLLASFARVRADRMADYVRSNKLNTPTRLRKNQSPSKKSFPA